MLVVTLALFCTTLLLLTTNISAWCKSDFAGNMHTCALIDDHTGKCWGYNYHGELGQGDKEYRGDQSGEMGNSLKVINMGAEPIMFATGGEHTCALLTYSQMKCWGRNNKGQLGIGNTKSKGKTHDELVYKLLTTKLGEHEAVAFIVAGDHHTCALLLTSRIKCWGHAFYGQLALGDKDNRGDDHTEMGDNLPYSKLGSGLRFSDLSAGGNHNCALTTDGEMKCWGSNDYGELGQGNTRRQGSNEEKIGNSIPFTSLGSGLTVFMFSCGSEHNCVIFTDGSLKCWGNNERGQLGYGDKEARGDEPYEMGNNLTFVDVGTGRTVLDVCGGYRHSCAVLDNYSLKCWGWNKYAQLGLGDTITRGESPNEMGNNLPTVDLGSNMTVESVHCGYTFTCAVLTDGSMKCWGSNDQGQLGQGSTTEIGGNPSEMGNFLPAINLGTNVYVEECFNATSVLYYESKKEDDNTLAIIIGVSVALGIIASCVFWNRRVRNSSCSRRIWIYKNENELPPYANNGLPPYENDGLPHYEKR